MPIPQAFIQELVARVDIVEVIGRYVQLRKGGANYMGLCPFHGEKSPSFSVSPSKQFFHCFGCGKNGNVIGFLMEHTGSGFREAVTDLAQQAGMTVPEEDVSPQDRARAAEQRDRRSQLVDTLAQAAGHYRQQLKQAPRAIDYLKGRGLSGEIARAFGLGYAPPGWRFLSTVFPDYQDALLADAGLVITADATEDSGEDARRYDRFRDRIMFPIRNVKGETIGFGGRVLDQGEPKYLNSPETPVFSKGHELYGLFEARAAIRQAGYALVTEGYMDVVALAQLGFGQAVATLGTACTADHLRLLFRFTDAVVFSFDGDAAGRRAARKALDAALPWASDTRSIRFLFLPPEHDPDSYIREHGSEAFAEQVKAALPLSRFLMEAAAAGCDTDTAEGRARLASQAEPMWKALPEGALKLQLLAEIADQVGLESRELGTLWKLARQGSRSPTPVVQAAPRGTDTPPGAQAAERPARSGVSVPEASSMRRNRSGTSPSAGRPWRRRGLLGRADRVARIALLNPGTWDALSADDQQLLAQQPAPHGPLFAWLESQWHEHGPQPWAALREALRGQAFEALACDLAEGAWTLEGEADAGNDDGELAELLRRLHIDALKALETAAISAAGSDPQALARYRELQTRRLALEQAVPDEPDTGDRV